MITEQRRVHMEGARVLLSLVTLIVLVGVMIPQATTAQTYGTIKGTVSDVLSEDVLLNANVIVVGTERGAASDHNGMYTITSVPVGEQKVKVSYIGYESETKTVNVVPDEVTVVNFNLREDFFQTEQIVVTATRSEKLMEDVPVVTELVTREEIEEKGAEDLAEVLEDRPGIAIESGATGGKFLYMNGVDSRRLLVMVDNVPVSGKLNNRIQLNLIDSDNIEHVEIVKGPGSALYGNDAMGGVINVITKNASDGFNVKANTRFGSNELMSGNLSFSGKNSNFDYIMNLDHFQEGEDQSVEDIEIKETQTSSANGKLRYNDENFGLFEVRGEYKYDKQNTESLYESTLSDNNVEVDSYTSSLAWSNQFYDQYGIQLTGFYSNNKRDYQSEQISPVDTTNAVDANITEDNLYGIKSDITYMLNEHAKFDFGVDFQNNEYNNERLASTQSRDQTGAFAQVETSFLEKITVIAGGRYDKITDIEGHFSPRVSAMYKVLPELKLRGSYGEAFRAPSFIELYSDFSMPGMPFKVIGNSELKPELSTGANLGIEYLFSSKFLLNMTVFHNKFEEMIVDYQQGMSFSYTNVKDATFKGIETQGRFYILNNLTLTLSYNYTDISSARIDDPSVDMTKETDIAFSKISPHTSSVRFNYRLFKNKLNISLRDQFFSKRDILLVSGGMQGQPTTFSTEKKDAYNLVDMTASMKVVTNLAMKVGVTNLTDFTDSKYGPFIGRKIFVGLAYGYHSK